MATLDLWLDGPEMDESAGWKQEVRLDFDRLGMDERYSVMIHDHIQRALSFLARELEEISVQNPPMEARLPYFPEPNFDAARFR